ncbi:MAG: maleate cis-trans isomerase family protein, partial [Acetobacteraceae bacterium]
ELAAATRCGLLIPSSNTVAEPMSQSIAASIGGLTLHFSRVRVEAISLDDRHSAQFSPDAMSAAASLLGDAHVDAVAWAGTSGSWLGVQADRDIASRLAAEARAPATTSTIALLAAARSFGIERIVLVTPYVGTVVNDIERTFAAEGIEVVAERHLDITRNFDFGQVPEQRLSQCARLAAPTPAQAVCFVCTNLAAARLAPQLEADIGIPVLDSVTVTLWHALRLAGREEAVAGWGRLLGGDMEIGEARQPR